MKIKRIQLLAVSVALVTMILMNQSSITNATWQAPKKVAEDTLVGSNDFFSEGLELVAAEGSALIAQYYQWDGQKTFPLNPSDPEYNNLDVLYIISSNQENWRDYWPRSIWEFRDGATVVFQFSQGLTDSLTDAEEIITELESWMGTTLDILYGAEAAGSTTLFYWGYMSAQNHSDFIIDKFYDVLSTGGYTNFITNDVLASAPVSVVGTGLARSPTHPDSDPFAPLGVAAFILEDGISINGDDVHNMSISSAFDFSGPIRPNPDSLYSKIEFKLPYVANVYDSYPATDNLYPELTQKFEWTLKAGNWIDVKHDDIYVTYDMAVEELETFPQITAELDVNATDLLSPTDPIMNYTIEMTNTGDEKAYNVEFAWDLGEKPEPHYINVFDSENFYFDPTVKRFYNHSSGLLVEDFALSLYHHNATLEFNISQEITGWFMHKENDSVVQVITGWNETTGIHNIDLRAVYDVVYTNKSFMNFKHSPNLMNTTLENGNFALYGSIDELDIGSSTNFWWAIDDLPAEDDTYLILAQELTNQDWRNNGETTFYMQNITHYDNTGNFLQEKTGKYITNIKDWIIWEMVENQSLDLRFPSLNPEFTPGVMFRFEDSTSREFFGWSNGLIVQLYDDEALLKTVISLNSTIFEIDETAEINVTIENIGKATASNVQVQGFHAQLGPDWKLRQIEEFSGEETVGTGTIAPGQMVTHTFTRNVSTFLGIHPVGVVVDYTTEESEGYDGAFNATDIQNIGSNLIVAIVLPKPDKAGQDEPSYPTPIVNVSVSWTDENGGDIENGDLIEIRTEVKNLGDEATTIKLFSYFPTRMASIDVYAQYYDGKNFKVTDISGNILTGYDEGFAMDHPDWPITVAAVAGLHLAPSASIIFYYKLTVTDAKSLIVPPVAVEYDSRYPMAGTSGIEGSSEEGEETSPIAVEIPISTKIHSEFSNIKMSIQAEDSSGSSWTSYSSSSLLSAYAAVTPPEESSEPTSTSGPPTSSTSGVDGFTTLTSFINENMRLMIVVLAIPIVVLTVRELKRSRK
ncbi:MAG: hypothetical protein ACFFB5_04800 [Promethearchaeota archaeon]